MRSLLKNAVSVLCAAALVLGMPAAAFAGEEAAPALEVKDRSQMTRTIVTTDLECDDMNSMIHLLLYMNELDVAGIVYTSSQFHFVGDGGKTTQGEANPSIANYEAQDPASLTEYRPQPIGWIENLVSNEYAEAYQYLVQNDPNYQSPEEILSLIKVGNVEFEGDVRFETEGSNFIKDCILDDDERTLYIQAWGGFNTTARALLSIAEEYKDTDQWEEIYQKVCEKVAIVAHGQDNTYEDHIKDLYPDLKCLSFGSGYAAFFAAKNSPANYIEMFQADWMKENIEFDHGPLMQAYILMGDGTYLEGEPDASQFGLHPVIDWSAFIPGLEPFVFNEYDFLGEGDSSTYMGLIPFGLRGLEDYNYGTIAGRISVNDDRDLQEYDYVSGGKDNFNRYMEAYQNDFAGRADWCVSTYEECNHQPIVDAALKDIEAAPGEVVTLEGLAKDPDGDTFTTNWRGYREGSVYSGSVCTDLRVWYPNQAVTNFTVPQDAVEGDYFNLIFEVTDDGTPQLTRYAQVIVHVVAPAEEEAQVQ